MRSMLGCVVLMGLGGGIGIGAWGKVGVRYEAKCWAIVMGCQMRARPIVCCQKHISIASVYGKFDFHIKVLCL